MCVCVVFQEELIEKLYKKADLLKEERTGLQEEIQENDALGRWVSAALFWPLHPADGGLDCRDIKKQANQFYVVFRATLCIKQWLLKG